jgi:hypothetical protein
VNQLARILFHVYSGDPDPFAPLFSGVLLTCFYIDIPVFADRQVILRNLIRLWQVRIEVILAVQLVYHIDLTMKCLSGPNSKPYNLLVQHRQGAWQPCANRTGVFVRLAAELR